MKILDLNILAYGPFTDRKVNFVEEGGLHVVLGPNEAGKSTALRALRALLYGIEERTTDNFLHENKGLKIGGRLRRLDGSELAFVRLKKRKDSLCTSEGAKIPDELLAEYLDGVTKEQFSMMFGIGYDELVEGGRDILQGEGEVGKLLFAASMGGRGLQKTLKSFEIRATDLFLPRASSKSINRGLSEYAEIKSKIKALSFSASEWEKLSNDQDKTKADIKRIDESLIELAAEKSRHERMVKVLPKVAERKALLIGLNNFIDVPELVDEFSAARNEAELRLESAQENKRNSERDIEGLSNEIGLIKVPESLLTGAHEIKQVQKKLGGIIKADDDIPQRRTQLASCQTRMRTLLDEIRPDSPIELADDLRKGQSKKPLIAALTDKYHQITSADDRIKKELRSAQNELAQKRTALEASISERDNSELKNTLTFVQRYQNSDEELLKLKTDFDRIRSGLASEAERLGLWTGPIEELLKAAVPSEETCLRFDSRFIEIETEIKNLKSEFMKLEKDQARYELEHHKLNSTGTIPTLDALLQSRVKRDEGWLLIKRNWLDGEALEDEKKLYASDSTLSEAFESYINLSDKLSDDLRNEADRVAANVRLLIDIESNSEEKEKVNDELAAAVKQLESLKYEWKSAWSGFCIEPLTPKEMRTWLSVLEKIRHMSNELLMKASDIKIKEDGIQSARELLNGSLLSLGEPLVRPDESFQSLISRCQAVAEKIDTSNSIRRDLVVQLEGLSTKIINLEWEIADSSALLADWQNEWAKSVCEIGLDGKALPTFASAVMTKIDEIAAALSEKRSLENRIAGMEKDKAEFEALVGSLVRAHAPDLEGLPATRTAEDLAERLERARNDSVRLEELNKQLRERKQALARSEETIQLMQDKLALLCKTACCESAEQLPEIERRSKEKRDVILQLKNLDKQLLELGEGRSIEELIAAAEDIDPDVNRANIIEIENNIELKGFERDEKIKTITLLSKGLEDVKGGSDAAIEAEKAAEKLASIRSDVDLYVRYTMAGMILKREIERYRQANQDPVMRMAGEFFSTMTCDEFKNLLQDSDEDGKPVIVGLRHTGKLVEVDGMSEGTRDQLYLSLRLASLIRYLEKREPLPFIVDDILIKFDDKRAQATLGILADLAVKTQVIFFTHHSRLADLAKGLGRKEITVQEL